MTTTRGDVDLATLVARLSRSDTKARYRAADPFPHIVLDDALDPGVFADARTEFPAIDAPLWNRYLQINQTKYANQEPERWGPTLSAVGAALNGRPFVRALEELTGFCDLVADPSMDGGGLHQTLRGGHLNIHRDFTTHHREHDWQRRVNVLLYLNETWRPEWGGALELWDDSVSECRGIVEPRPNRMMVFTTSGVAFHGHPTPLDCPANVARRSLALYYFTVEERPLARSTDYRARPGDGLRAAAIWADARALRAYDIVKRRFGISDDFAHRLATRLDRRRGRRGPSGDAR